MAAAAVAKVEAAPDDTVAREMLRRLARAELDWNRHRRRLDDVYRYALPWRHRSGNSQPSDYIDDIFDETLMVTIEDFAADMMNVFTPQKAEWVDVRPVRRMGAGEQNQIRNALAEYKAVLFEEMQQSNLTTALQEAYLDLSPGTMALAIQDIAGSEPIHCEAIPTPDLRLDRGPWGTVGGRFRSRKMRLEDVSVLWPAARHPHERSLSGDAEAEVVDGLWRDWSVPGTERWTYAVLVDGVKVLRSEFEGEGSCPIVVARWSRDPTTAWGIGPGYRVLPAVKAANHIKYLTLKNLDKNVDPITSFEDDGVMNLDTGLEAGLWLPRASGSKPPEVIEPKGKFDLGVYELDDLRSAIKRAHYQDEPEQLGKTPPTATQWADEAAKRARRMGTPATNLVHELQYPIVKRFAYLLEQRGVLPKVRLGGEEIRLQPVSPLLRAQEQEEVVRIDRFLEILSVRFGPQAVQALVKMPPTVRKLAERMGIPVDLVNSEAEMQAMMERLAEMAQQAGVAQ